MSFCFLLVKIFCLLVEWFCLLGENLQKKAPYQEKAEKRKVEYNKNMDVYNKKQVRIYGLIVRFGVLYGLLGYVSEVCLCNCV